MKKSILITALVLALIMTLLKWTEYGLFSRAISLEVYVGLIAGIFTAVGIWMGLKLTTPKTLVVHKNEPFEINEERLISTGISNREYEVLEKMSIGYSNQEIADDLFISLNTVKTHISNLYDKLDVKRRTQAIQEAKKKGLLP